MSHVAINSALSLRLKALGLPTQFENAQFTPTAGVLYLAEFYMPAQTSAVGMETGSTEDYLGIYQVSVFAPRDATKGVGMAAAQSVLAWFQRGTHLDAQGAKVTMNSGNALVWIEQVNQYPGLLTGDRWMIPVRARYRALIREPISA